ncbi:MAG: MFS transporter [Chloroflexi bacterium]|nr:MFS transporter [Chloroflexota bacterium]MCY3582609.1 MFS transporter [Chloroflexota bacterium]MCY3715808.1 MFS transporter [Chloroflexota bacterium]MDE2649844.1 MFS transporter [Chloroflexota bacterium]
MVFKRSELSARQLDIMALLATILAPSMVFMVSTALSVALPAIQRDLQASGTDLIWIVNAYSLLQAAFIFISGSFGDHFGRRRFYIIGIVIFSLASFVCGTTQSANMLILARAAQGMGSGMMITCSLAIVAVHFAHHRRSWSIGVWSAFTMLISGAGPILGGWLTELGLWRLIFLVNLLLGPLAIAVLLLYVQESYDDEAPAELDMTGTILSTLTLLLAGFFFIEGPRRGFDDPAVLLAGAGAIIILPAFVWIEGHSDHPMMPLNLFRSRTFTGANTLTLLLYGAINTVLFFLPLELIQVQGYSESAVGIALLPMTLMLVGVSFVINRVVDRYGPRLPLICGPLVIGCAMLILSELEVTHGQDTYVQTLLPTMCLFGVGMGITLAPLTTAVMASVNEHYAGLASGLNNTVSRSAQILAIAAMGSMAILVFQNALLSDPLVLSLPDDARAFLLAESVRLAETPSPAGLSAQEDAALREGIRRSFSESIRSVMIISAALSIAAGMLASKLIENELPPE